MNYEEIHINVPWGHIAGRWYGNRNIRPLLALHGWQDNLGTFDRLLPLLPHQIGVLCVDFPGHGRSSRLPNGVTYHMIDFVFTICYIMKEYKWKKVSLLGHSLGGIVGFMYAALYPQRVDLLIQLDILMVPLRHPDNILQKLRVNTEKLLVENERLEQFETSEPPSSTYDQLEEKLYLGSKKSIEKENCKYILNRSINASRTNSEKYYFSRDGRLKYYQEFIASTELIEEMTKRFQNIHYLIIKYKNSNYIEDYMVDAVRKIHTKMVVKEVEGSHHAHLNNPEDVAAIVAPFILRAMSSTNFNDISLNNLIQSKL